MKCEKHPLLRHLENFERIVNWSLLVMASVVLLATIESAWILFKDALTPLLEIHELLELFSLFLLVHIGIELLHSVKTFIIRRENGNSDLESKA